MKKLILTAVALAVIASAPAHAINAKYREQLIKSGCTQVSINQGCDIHKTKAQNQARSEAIARTPHGKEDAKTRAWLESVALGAPINEVADSLLAQGWRPNQGEWLKGGKHLQLTVADDKVVAANLY